MYLCSQSPYLEKKHEQNKMVCIKLFKNKNKFTVHTLLEDENMIILNAQYQIQARH